MHVRRARSLAILALAVVVAAVATAQAPERSPRKVALKAARLIDGTGAAPMTNAVVLIEGDRITAVGSGLAIPKGYEVVDLGMQTLMPGFIDCHTHVTSQPGEFYEDIFRKSKSYILAISVYFVFLERSRVKCPFKYTKKHLNPVPNHHSRCFVNLDLVRDLIRYLTTLPLLYNKRHRI